MLFVLFCGRALAHAPALPFPLSTSPSSHNPDDSTQLDALIAREDGIARAAAAAKTRPAALAALRRRRLLETQAAGVDAYAGRVEDALATLDSAARAAAVFGALRAGADALQSLQASLPVAAIERLASDSAAAREYEDRAAAALAASPNAGAEEDAAEAELAALEAAVSAEEAAALPAAPEVPLPAVPSGRVEQAGRKEWGAAEEPLTAA